MVASDTEAPSTGRIARSANARRATESASAAEARHSADLYVRTSWVDAALALSELEKGNIEGGRTSLWIRAWLQEQLFVLGCFLQANAGKVLFVAVLVLTSFCVGLKSAQVHSRVDQLWVQEGGRLEAELRYTAKALGEADSSTHQMVIQTAQDPDASLLHPGALLDHLKVVQAATHVSVYLYDIEWRLKDLCYSPSVPEIEGYHIEKLLDNILPCAIITPLDCFWEGSKLLGPSIPISIPGLKEYNRVQWTNLNPQEMLEKIKGQNFGDQSGFQFPLQTVEAFMKRAGVSTGYMEKPCLNPKDKLCPQSAPNKKTGQAPDVASVLSDGCYGFAAAYMYWPQQLMVGGALKNVTSELRSARALQTVVQLMGEREMYEYWADNYKVHHVGWTQEKAAAVLDAWQRKFAAEVRRQMASEAISSSYAFYPFSTATLNDILGKFSEVSLRNIAIGYVIMLFYVGMTLVKWQEPVRSQAGVGIAGVLLLSITVAAGFGLCSILGIPFNASSTQIVPFLALGLGVQDMFLLTHAYVEQGGGGDVAREERTGLVLKKSGLSVLLTSLCNVLAFLAAALLPIPALRVFCLQAAILLTFNLAAMLLVFPAMISLDLRRRSAYRSDMLCCFIPEESKPHSREKKQSVTRALPPDRLHTVTSVIDKGNWRDSSREPLDPESTDTPIGFQRPSCFSLSISSWARNHYAPFIMKPAIKVLSILALIVMILGSVWLATKVTDGLDLTDIVPENTDEHEFLSRQEKFFGFYNMYAVTQGDFEYPTNQELLYEYHDQFVRIPNIIKNDNGGLTKFWLSMFHDWLVDLQKAFDKDFASGCINQEGWYKNASEEGILAYKLLVQTGHVDNPIDKSQIGLVKLVEDKVINPKAFYNYLSAWASNDALAYGASQGNLKPQPKRWTHIRDDTDLRIPKSSPLIYTQLPFYLSGLSDTDSIKTLIQSVRDLCLKFEARGLSNYPSGIPFLFWEQYLYLRTSLSLALACALAAVFVVVMILLLNAWAALLVVGMLCTLVLQLLAAMALLDVKLSAIPAVLLIVAVGIGVHFTVHLCLGFVTSIGCRDRRARLALELVLAPVVHGAIAAALAAGMLAASDFGFVARLFLRLLMSLVAAGMLDGLLFFPVLLALIGPAAEVRPLEHPERLSTPSPKSSPRLPRKSTSSADKEKSRAAKCTPRPAAGPSLTTITEEPPSWHSSGQSVQSSLQSIVVQPEVVVETTTYNGSGDSGSDRSTPTPHPPGAITTKVTATANIKVEVVTPGDRKPRRSYHYYERRRDDEREDRHRDRRDRHRDERDHYYGPRESRDSGHESDSSRH